MTPVRYDGIRGWSTFFWSGTETSLGEGDGSKWSRGGLNIMGILTSGAAEVDFRRTGTNFGCGNDDSSDSYQGVEMHGLDGS
mmetsp:Transcript_6160/g.9344  ORF Transcript_6160/g.9344 Transcript_6160/m.9344 type:complete len:82 (+) Transcript_6160:1188-1433(+)